MHKKFLAFVLPVLGGLAVIGSGFATWVFTDEVGSTVDATGTVTVTGLSSAGNLTVDVSDLTLELDQGGAKNASDLTKGITWKNGDASVTELRFTFKYDPKDVANLTYNYTLTVANTDASKDVKVLFANTNEVATAKELTTIEDDTSTTESTTDKIGTIIYTLPTKWKAGEKPQSTEEYNKLKDLAGGGLKITATVTVSAK